MKQKSHQQQHDQKQPVAKENLIANGKYLHDQAIGTAIIKVLSPSRSALQDEPKTWHQPGQMKYS